MDKTGRTPVEDLDSSLTFVQPVGNPLAFLFIYLVYWLLKQLYGFDYFSLITFACHFNLLTCLMFSKPVNKNLLASLDE